MAVPGSQGSPSAAPTAGRASVQWAAVAVGATFLIGSGVVYALLWLYGLLIDHHSEANFVPLNGADNWLHLVLAAGMLALGLALGRTGGAPDSRQG